MAAMAWDDTFMDAIKFLPELGSDIHYTKSAEMLRNLMKKPDSPCRLTDLRDHPDRFFKAHRLATVHATKIGPGFGIRYTVQYNLFAGTILALGNDEQVTALNQYQAAGKLGCFCLTEKFAGVSSGLVVNATANWDEAKGMFLIDCPDEDAKKNWISQGLTADMCVVIAQLFVKGKKMGPHAFVTHMRDDSGKLRPEITVEDMGGKTIGNDLDNARVTFTKMWLPKSALLDRWATIDDKGEYVQRVPGTPNQDMILQRLYTGRVVIAGSAIVFARSLYKQTRDYADNKKCWHPKGHIALSDIPQLSNLYTEAEQAFQRVDKLQMDVEEGLCKLLPTNAVPPESLIEKVSVLKVKAIETAINYCFKLKQEVGSYALMDGTGFEKMDYLQCCKFAEGDSRILMQKLARDRLQAFAKEQTGAEQEAKICMELGQALMAGGKAAWNENWKLVYGLADAIIDRVVETVNTQSSL